MNLNAILAAFFLAAIRGDNPEVFAQGDFLRIQMDTREGYTYSLQESWNLLHWEQIYRTSRGSGKPISFSVYIKGRGAQMAFFRVLMAPNR